MRQAFISDIHGNIEALTAVLRDIESKNIDSILCLGDIVGYYPDPQACIDLVRTHTSHCIAGNHDYAAIGKVDIRTFTYYALTAMEWTKKHLTEDALDFLSRLPLRISIGEIFCAHSSPADQDDWSYVFPDSESEVYNAFHHIIYRLNFIGHTHWPAIIYQDGDKIIAHGDTIINLENAFFYLVNVGSVGQPRDFDPRSAYAIYDSDAQTIQIVRVSYDYTLTQQKIISCGLPTFLAERLQRGR